MMRPTGAGARWRARIGWSLPGVRRRGALWRQRRPLQRRRLLGVAAASEGRGIGAGGRRISASRERGRRVLTGGRGICAFPWRRLIRRRVLFRGWRRIGCGRARMGGSSGRVGGSRCGRDGRWGRRRRGCGKRGDGGRRRRCLSGSCVRLARAARLNRHVGRRGSCWVDLAGDDL